MSRLNLLEETRFEKLLVKVFANQAEASKVVARRIANLILSKQQKGEQAILAWPLALRPSMYTKNSSASTGKKS